MIQALKNSGRLQMTILLGCMSLFCFCLSLLRYKISGQMLYLFLNWNLFLAFVPWAVATGMVLKGRSLPLFATILLVCTWLLFFPNAPYILTDLFHLRPRDNGQIWFDLVLILSFAWTGMTFGFVSLTDMENMLTKSVGGRSAFLITTVLLFIAAFGVYLGRYLRFNSWDALLDPAPLYEEIRHRVVYPGAHPRTWGMTLFMGILLNMMYRTFRFFSREKIHTAAK